MKNYSSRVQKQNQDFVKGHNKRTSVQVFTWRTRWRHRPHSSAVQGWIWDTAWTTGKGPGRTQTPPLRWTTWSLMGELW